MGTKKKVAAKAKKPVRKAPHGAGAKVATKPKVDAKAIAFPAVELSKADIAALTAFVSNDDTRPHLCAVRFEPASGHAVATNGHVLVVRKTEPQPGEPFEIFAYDLKQAAALLEKKGRVYVSAGSIKVNGQSLSPRKVNAPYPPWRLILPDASKQKSVCRSVGINAEYLGLLRLLTKAAGCVGVAVSVGEEELDPVVFRSDSAAVGAQYTTVIMPMRASA